MANHVRLDFKKEGDIKIENGKIIEECVGYSVYICEDGISAWLGSGHTLEDAIRNANDGEEENCILDKMQTTLSCDELEAIECTLDDNYTIIAPGGYEFDARNVVTLDNILNHTEQGLSNDEYKNSLIGLVDEFNEKNHDGKNKLTLENLIAQADEHKKCVMNRVVEVVSYGDGVNTSIECVKCNETLIDSDVLNDNQ